MVTLTRLMTFFFLLLVVSCKKESTDVFVSSVDSADTVWVDNSTTDTKSDFQQLLDTLIPAAQKNEVSEIEKNQGLVFPNDIIVTLPPNTFTDASGQLAKGPATILLMYLSTRGDMLKNHISGVSDEDILKTLFAVKLFVYQNGKELRLAPGKAAEIFIGNSSPVSGYQLFTEKVVGNPVNWIPAQGGSFSIGSHNAKKGYVLLIPRLQWFLPGQVVNVEKTTSITASLPKIFTNANSKVYVLLDDRKGLMEMGQDKNQKAFYANKIPVSSRGTIVSISSVNNTYYLASEDVELKHKLHIKLTPRVVSLTELNSFISSLQ